MRRLVLLGWVVLLMAACSKGEEELPLRTPVITLDNPLAIYPLKSGEKLTIHPTYGYTDDRTLYRWTLNGKVIGRDSLLQFSSEGVAVGRYYVTLSVTNPRGTSDKELRIDVLALDPPQVTLPGSEEGLHILQHSELTLTPQITSSLASTCRWWIGEQPITWVRQMFLGDSYDLIARFAPGARVS